MKRKASLNNIFHSLRHALRGRPRRSQRPSVKPACETLEDRCLPAFSVTGSGVYGPGTLRLLVDLNQPANAATVQPGDLVLDGALSAASVNLVDADTIEFFLPALGAGSHTASIAAGAMLDTQGTGLDAYNTSFAIASAPQFAMQHNPRLQPGDAPLAGYAGSELDRADVLWQTIPAGTGTQDSFSAEYRALGAATWQTASLNTPIDTGVENRVVRSASITGLNWNADYEYRVQHRQADVIVGLYQSTFTTRLQAGDQTAFTFAAYGDSASGSATGFREVQARINAVNPAFAVLLGDNVYSVGSHQESDARFDPSVNPEAAAWMAGHIDYLGLGNHDVGTASGLPSEQNYSVPIPVAGVTAPAAPPATERPEHSFSWDYGGVHFLTFDTNSYSNSARLDALLNWAITDLNASTARWKIVYGHHPLAGVPDKPENPGGNYYQQVVNRLKAAGADLFMTGHSHTYSWTYPLTGQINGTATYADHGEDDRFHSSEGLTQLVSGVGGVEVRPGTYSQFPFVAEGFTSTTPVPARLGFAQVSVTPDQLTVSYVAADDGTVIDSFVIEKDPNLQTASFQQGANGYTGTADTFLHQNAPNTNNAAAASLKVDGDDPAGTGLDAQALLRFDSLFGSGAGQIPLNATLRSATLQLQVTNGSVNNMNLHRMIGAWSAADTWNTLGGGVQTDGAEAVAAPDTSSGQSQAGALSFNVLASLQAWLANPASNNGWAIVPTGTDGVDFHSSEGAIKPKLIVSYAIETGPNDPPAAQDDSATADGNTPVTISVLSNDSDPNGDSLSVESVTQPAHGSAAIDAGGTVTYTAAAGYFGSDSFTYTIGDGRGGSASATVNMTVVSTAVFQQGSGGYSGAADTFLQQNAPGVNNAAAVSLNVDSDDPAGTGLDVQTLLAFYDLFGSGAGQVPTNATLHSATLQLQVTNPGNSMNLHRMLMNWGANDTWNSLAGGVQNDGVEARVSADVSTGAAAIGLLTIDVLPSLLAWLETPASNLGWVLLPTGTDGVDFDSSEGATKPKLIVTYIPASSTPPTIGNIANQTADEDTSAGPLTFTVGDAETAAASLTVSGSSSNTALVPNANLVFGGSGGNRTLTVTPAANQSGTATITVTVTDADGATASDTFVLTVSAVNDVPTVGDIANQTADEDTSTGALAFTVGDVETAAASLSVSGSSSNTALVPNANLVFGGSGGNRTLTVTPAANQSGTATITVTVTDADGAAVSDTFVLTVNAVNDAPVAGNDTASTTGTAPVTIAVLANDSDVEGSTLSVSLVSGPANGTATVNANGTVTYTANAGFAGTDSFTYRVSDGTANSSAATVTLTVLAATKFFVADSTADKTFRYQANGTYVSQSSLASGNTNSRGVAASADGSTLWVLDNNKTVYVYNSSLVLLGSWTASGLKAPTGISVTGADVWIVDSNTDRAYVYAGAATRRSGSAAATGFFNLGAGNTNPQDLVTDGTAVWVVHSGSTDKIFVYQASNGASLGSWTIDSANTTPTGITLDPTGGSNSLWTVDSGTDRIYEYANGRTRRTASQTASLSLALNSANGNAQGIADPPDSTLNSATSEASTASESPAFSAPTAASANAFLGDTPAFTLPYFLNWDFAEAPVWTLGNVVRLPVEAPVPSAPVPPTTPANRPAVADSFVGRKPGDELGIAALDMFFAVWPQAGTPASPIWTDAEEWEK